MGRLKSLPGRFGRAPRRVSSLPKTVDRFYQSAEWKDYRKRHRAWTRQTQGGLWCKKCGATGRLILDHIIERKDGGEDFPPFEGAEWLCIGCHNRKTAQAKARRAGVNT